VFWVSVIAGMCFHADTQGARLAAPDTPSRHSGALLVSDGHEGELWYYFSVRWSEKLYYKKIKRSRPAAIATKK
jgi:hypothetical protein